MSRIQVRLLTGVLVVLLLVLGGALLVARFAGTSCACASTPAPLVEKLTVGLGYIPSVQFAQFYRAQQQGYYRDQALDVTFQNEIDPNLITLVRPRRGRHWPR